MKYCEKSIRTTCKSNEEILRTIYNNMMIKRQRETLKYRPITENKYLTDIHLPGVDFSKVFTEFEDGDYAFITYDAEGPFEKDLIHNVYNFSDVELYVNGEPKVYYPKPDGSMDVNVTLTQGRNNFILKVTAKEGRFQTYFKFLMHEIRMIPRHYVYSARQYINMDGFRGQNGVAISRLYRKNEVLQEISTDTIEWIYPVKPVESNEKCFDFVKWLDNGCTAYAYTCFEGNIMLRHSSPMKVFADGKEVYCGLDGEFKATFSKVTALLIKCRRNGENWGFKSVSEGVHTLPFAETDDCSDLKWIWIGPFGRESEPIDHPYPPESNLYFDDAYSTVNGKKVYWKFYREHTSLYQELTSNFYGQWFYAMMVGMNGLRVLADKLNISEIYDYFNSSMKLMAEHRKYACYECERSGRSSYIPGSVNLDRLDPIGTIGMNMAECYLMTADKSVENMLLILSDAMMYNVPRFEDGTFNRIDTMWTDDMYMCLPFLARLGVVMEDTKYFDEIVNQIRGFYQRMYMEDQNIFSHIYFPKEKFANHVPWGRGNGWVLLAMSEALPLIPEDYEQRGYVLDIFRKFAKGVLDCRDRKEGIWHQVINNHDSFVETSGSAMFITALARGIRLGWIDKAYTEDVLEAWEALTDKCIDSEGNLYGVCQGSGCNKEEKYYLNLKTITNDDHGIGIVLGAGVEIMNLLGE